MAIWIILAVLAAVLGWLWWAGERGRWLPSTRAYFRESGFHLAALHGYVYGRWTKRYIGFLFGQATPDVSENDQWLADHYHAKTLTHEHARAIVTVDRPIPLLDLEQVVPFPVARNLVLDSPLDIVAYECPCRHNRPSPCTPTQVCMVIGKPMTDFMLEHQPESSRRLTTAEALALLEAEHARGHVHTAWFKDAMFNRFYALCNCCKCCCGGISNMRRGVAMVASSGYVAEIDAEACAHCYDCVPACPFDALTQTDDGVVREWSKCLGCGVCETACATGAIRLVRDERKGIPLDVRALPTA
jgi:Pyruvate/2-oxoacid:ferredoxin oxidoreductase delta subunit